MNLIEQLQNNKGKNVKIAIIDSGISFNHSSYKNKELYGCFLKFEEKEQNLKYKKNFNDNLGHGTAIYDIINKLVPESEIFVIKIFDNELETSEEHLIQALEYISKNFSFDVINLSMGINMIISEDKLRAVCKKLSQKTVIISAFDNTGAISYPAAFDCVIGVDSGDNCNKDSDFEYVNNSIVNIRAKGGVQRLAWSSPEYIVTAGNSFASAYVCGYTAKIIEMGINNKAEILKIFSEISKEKYESNRKYIDYIPKFSEIKKAAIFPFNKEMHSLVRFSNLLSFQLVDIYDVKYSGRVGAFTSRILGKQDVAKNYKIKNIDTIDWDSFDTLILGHTDELEKALTSKLDKLDLFKNCIKHRKNIYSFDPISNEYCEKFKQENLSCYFPQVCINNVPQNQFGKMHLINKPVLGVLGTNSKQGKFTLQLELRKRFIENGYKIGQLGTEPTALLFGMDSVYHSGYNAHIFFDRWENYIFTNKLLHEIARKENDILLVGSQSSVTPYCYNNTNFFNPFHLEFIQACQFDAVILTINAYDTFDYIKRTIQTIEGICDAKVIALVMFPMKLREDYGGLTGAQVKIQEEEFETIKMQLCDLFKLNVYNLDNQQHIDQLYSFCIDYFSD